MPSPGPSWSHLLRRFLPMRDLVAWRPADLRGDLAAAAAVTVLTVPQGVAYALIAGLPPAIGLYAAALPTLVGALFRSSRFVVSGPTNALSLLVGGAVATVVATRGADPTTVAFTLAFLVGAVQVAAGLLRLGMLVDYISSPVVLGYITGAATLIAADQLPNLTGTPMHGATLIERLPSWFADAGHTDVATLVVGLSTTALVVILRRVDPRIPGPLVAMAGGIAASMLLDLQARGVRVVADIASVAGALPPITGPDFRLILELVPMAIAATVLSLVESSAVARSLSERTGERLDADVEFVGQGLANLAASAFSGYPISGSPSRSALNLAAGARTRLSGAFAGVMMLGVVLLAGPLVDHTPIAGLAGLLLVLAWDLVDLPRIRLTLRSGIGDVAAFLFTLGGAWALDLDKAIYLGVVISIVLFLRRARLLLSAELAVDAAARLREARSLGGEDDDEEQLPLDPGFHRCSAVRVVHVEGSLFFGAASELQDVLDEVLADRQVRVLVLRLKRCQGVDVTTADVLKAAAGRMRGQGRWLLLVGMRPDVARRMDALGVPEALGHDNLFPTEPGWFVAMDRALTRGLALVGPHEEGCPLERYLERRRNEG